ncbi:lysophospholipid acyltransferase family protein [Calditerrivibrio nitroreducens]|uniref:Lipid A biosynthesis acyltransferase n=1 Tax=Calditerrivibrio nitroreducens (strain DSM 19672 / NBRC 101217 / Yu37-1) TaxID=768670 RepID=E4TF82_CALNY|nr:lipid A biosynthesis acyltransferase [Calditerrivibrio nitroreducens]ADR18421.1 lipid A biosynthesis acyltransferase [Calditerrivibrio nitroreducens DSM 19672]
MLLIKIIVFLLTRCNLKTLHMIGSVLGITTYYLLPGRRRIARKNLRIALGENFNEKILKESFKNSFKSMMEIFYTNRIDELFIAKNIRLNDLTYIKEALEKCKPIFLITGHIGSWEFLPAVYSSITKGKIAIVGKSTRSKKIDDILHRLRTGENIHFISHSNAIVSIQRFFKKGIPVGALLDQGGLEKNCFFIDFFGIKTTFVKGLPIYASKIGALILIGFLIREDDKYTIKIYPPIEPDERLDHGTAAEKLAYQINQIYEDIIRKYPEQWFTLNKRFKRVLENENGKIGSIY